MKRESKLWIYFLLQLIEQMEKQAQEMPDLIQLSPKELTTLKDDLFDLTIEQTVDADQLSDEELRKEVLSQLLDYLDDTKRFPLKNDLRQFAEKLGVSNLRDGHTKIHIIGAFLLEVRQWDRPDLERILRLMQGKEPSHQESPKQSAEKSNDEGDFNWADFMNSVKK